jgi:hypothetical protein
MIALITTYFLIFYILAPGALFRFFTSWFVPLKLFERTRTQEATFAVAVALLPFALALFGAWYLPVMRDRPFSINGESAADRRQDYHRVAGILTSSDASHLLTGTPASTSPASNEPNWHALNRVLRRQARFLTWYFLITACEGLLFGFLAGRYGDWKIIEGASSTTSATQRRPLIRFYNWIAPKIILPNISEWYMLLTDFTWPKHEEIFVRADILQIDGNLYQGRVADYFIDSAGKLTGILLEHVSRFDRLAYMEAKGDPTASEFISSTDFWKNIPSQNFYIRQASISNLNVRFVPRDETLISIAEKILDDQNTQAYDVVVTPGEAHAHQPDLYS